jgi:xanthine/uracil permease
MHAYRLFVAAGITAVIFGSFAGSGPRMSNPIPMNNKRKFRVVLHVPQEDMAKIV